MRHYPSDSPQAAARIVALAMLADGHLSKAELDVLDRLEVDRALGLSRAELHAVVHGLCEDLLSGATLCWTGACRVDAATLAALMAEIGDPRLQRQLLQLCLTVAEADHELSEGESRLLVAAVTHWGLRDEFHAPATAPAGQH